MPWYDHYSYHQNIPNDIRFTYRYTLTISHQKRLHNLQL